MDTLSDVSLIQVPLGDATSTELSLKNMIINAARCKIPQNAKRNILKSENLFDKGCSNSHLRYCG